MPLNRLIDSGNPIQPPPDVQRTSLGLDVMGRFVCNTWDEAVNNGGKPFDAVVIGAGMFGGSRALWRKQAYVVNVLMRRTDA